MKIESIEFKNHKILGTFTIDLKRQDGTIFNNIVFAGENGAGKTTILEEINVLRKMSHFLTIEDKSNYNMKLVVNVENDEFYSPEKKKIVKFELKKDNDNNNYFITFIEETGNKVGLFMNHNIDNSDEILYNLNFESIMSKTDINYIPITKITNVGNKTLDNNDFGIPNDLARDITQTFIDVVNQDANEMVKWIDEHDERMPEAIKHKKVKRFTTAFEKIFKDELKYSHIAGNVNPIFKKNGNEISIDALSTGEKQIVFRGIFLLRNMNSINGIPILIDEPELSMHPKWEEKIFDYYTSMFKDIENNIQNSQVFIATHSEHILKSALEDEDTIIIKLKEDKTLNERFYKGAPGNILNTVTLAEIKWKIFDLITIDLHIQLYSALQENKVTDNTGNIILEPSIKKTDEYLERIINGNTSLLKNSNYKSCTYKTLSTYIRNCIDHPNVISSVQPGYSEEELKSSIEFMISII